MWQVTEEILIDLDCREVWQRLGKLLFLLIIAISFNNWSENLSS